VFTLTACSAVKLAYNNVDTYVYWTLNRYVDFNANQAPLVKAEIKSIHAWHRSTELPKYITLLEAMRVRASNDVRPSETCAFASDIEMRYQALSERFGQSAEKIMPMIQVSQLPNVQKALDKSNQEWQKDWLQDNEEDRIEKRLDKALERATSFYGKLNDNQVALIKQNIIKSKFDANTHYRYRLSRQKIFIDTLNRVADQELQATQLKTAITALVNNTVMADAVGYERYIDALIQDTCTDAATFHNTTTTAQRAHLVKQLSQYIDDFNRLQNTP
jgi:hypothetical protein